MSDDGVDGTGMDEVAAQILATAQKKLAAGETLSREEYGAVRRFQESREASERERLLRHLPIGVMLKMARRPRKQLDDQAVRLGIPFSGTDGVVNLYDVIGGFFDWYGKNSDAIGVALRDAAEGSVRARIKLVELKKKEMELDKASGKLVEMAAALKLVGEVAGICQKFCETAEKEYGVDRAAGLRQELQRWKDAMEREHGGDGAGGN